MSKLKGEVPFEVDGTSYVLVFSIDALIAMEEHWGKSVREIGEMVQGEMMARDLKELFRYGLLENHPELDGKAIGGLLSAVGIIDVCAMLAQAFTVAFTGGQKAEADAKPRPPKRAPAAGNGQPSSPSGASTVSESPPASGD